MRCVIGLSYGHHESSATLFSEKGDILYLREEWLSRVKGDHRFPKFSLHFIEQRVIENNWTLVAVSLFEKPLKTWLMSGLEKGLSVENYLTKIRQFRSGDMFFEKNIKSLIPGEYETLYCPHHLSHALTSSAFSDYAGDVLHLIMDGYGDGSSGGVYVGKGPRLNEIASFSKNSSLGIIYSAITEWAGFIPNEDEYKVMALAAFGNPVHSAFINDHIIRTTNNGNIHINKDFFNFSDLGISAIKSSFTEVFGESEEVLGSTSNIKDNQKVCDVICSFQSAIETNVTTLINYYMDQFSQIEAILLGGGLFHNSRLVGILSRNINRPVFVSPTPGDAGSSIGASYFAGLCLNFPEIRRLNPFCGPDLEDLAEYPHLFRRVYSPEGATGFAKQILDNGEVFATFSGACEVGPRALGARSLCCNAQSTMALTHLNEIIKQREGFRPIAPIFTKKLFNEIFDISNRSTISSTWMGQLVWPKSGLDTSEMPFLHKDNSARVQIVDENDTDSSTKIPKVILECLSDSYIIANTSFNIAGDPMVFSVEDCYINCMRLEIKYILSNNEFYEVLQ